jgi:hypothetical protein
MEEIRKERTVEGEIKEYVTKDEITETVEAQSFIYASDALFIDNSVDRKSSQGYIIKLFGD